LQIKVVGITFVYKVHVRAGTEPGVASLQCQVDGHAGLASMTTLAINKLYRVFWLKAEYCFDIGSGKGKKYSLMVIFLILSC